MINKIYIKVRKVKRIGITNARPIRIVHSLDGMLGSLDTQKLLRVIKHLVKKVDYRDVDFIIGFDSGGIIPSLFFAQLTRKPLLIAYKLKLDLPNRIKFLEPHAARKNIYIYGLKKGDKVILIDDEIYSGDGMVEAIKEFRKREVIVKDIVCLVESRRFNARKKLKELGFELKSYFKHNF